MKNLTKTFSFTLIAIVLFISSISSVFATANIPEATTDFYVNDFANVFTDQEKTTLMNNAVKLANEYDGIQVVISTVKSLDGDTIENYGYNMYKKYGIGKDDMGILILLSTGDRQIRVEVGRAMEAYINDAKAGRFIDTYAISYLKDNKFNEGLISLQTAFIKEITECVSAEKTISSTSNSDSLPNIDFSILFIVLGVIVLLALLIYIIFLITNKIKKRKALITDLNSKILNLENTISNLKKQHTSEKKELTKVIGSLEHTKHGLESTLSNIKNDLNTLKDRYNRILIIYPDVDSKVDEMIKREQIEKDKDIAASVDSLISDVICLSPDKDIVERVYSVISDYNNLTSEQKSYIKNDFSKLENLYKNSLKLKQDYENKLEQERIQKLTEQRKNKANSVTKEILSVISVISYAKAHHLYKLNDAKRLYEDLDSETQKYVDDSVISKLNSLIKAAKRDKDDEDRRKRQQSYSSFNSSSRNISSGGFRGFGGRPGGGGASRGF